MTGFDVALGFTLSMEGGYTLADGTPTNYGVRQPTYDKWRTDHGAIVQPVTKITSVEASNLYRDWYWEPCSCDAVPYPVAVCIFDTAVNSGQTTAIRLLQRASWADEDGVVGADTMALLGKADPYQIAHSYITLRRLYYRALTGKIADQSLRGWLNRCDKLWVHIDQVKHDA